MIAPPEKYKALIECYGKYLRALFANNIKLTIVTFTNVSFGGWLNSLNFPWGFSRHVCYSGLNWCNTATLSDWKQTATGRLLGNSPKSVVATHTPYTSSRSNRKQCSK